MWTKPACWGVQFAGLGLIVPGLMIMVTLSVFGGAVIFLAGLGLVVLGGVKIRERLKQEVRPLSGP